MRQASAMELRRLGRKMANLSKNFTETIATVAAHKVASSAVPTMAVGLVDPDAARMAIAVIGINCTELVLIARKVHIAFVATPGCGLSVSRSRIARKPRGVAALPRPSMFAAMFINIDPIAGCSAGTSGKSLVMTGRSARPMRCTNPARSARSHHAEPQRHDPDQRERNRDRRLRAVERTRRYIFEPIIPAADRHRQQDQREPDVIEHASRCSRAH